MSQPQNSRRVVVQSIDGSEIVLTGLSTTTTIRELKLKICDHNDNLSVGDQTLLLPNSDPPVVLEDSQTFEHYGILNDFCIHLVTSDTGRMYTNPEDGPKLKNIFIKDASGRTLTLHDIPLHMTVGAFFEKVQREKGQDGDIRLVLNGKELRPENENGKSTSLTPLTAM
ncbi:MAG: hypothetical protein M1839_006691 [Geoglossum umbratile]|nr:MAG: hypothetical protein M1839_006691 [Geoglossum umbratile]